MYIDVVEFRHKHFIHSFREIAGVLRMYANALIHDAKVAFPFGVDPSLAYPRSICNSSCQANCETPQVNSRACL